MCKSSNWLIQYRTTISKEAFNRHMLQNWSISDILVILIKYPINVLYSNLKQILVTVKKSTDY